MNSWPLRAGDVSWWPWPLSGSFSPLPLPLLASAPEVVEFHVVWQPELQKLLGICYLALFSFLVWLSFLPQVRETKSSLLVLKSDTMRPLPCDEMMTMTEHGYH